MHVVHGTSIHMLQLTVCCAAHTGQKRLLCCLPCIFRRCSACPELSLCSICCSVGVFGNCMRGSRICPLYCGFTDVEYFRLLLPVQGRVADRQSITAFVVAPAMLSYRQSQPQIIPVRRWTAIEHVMSNSSTCCSQDAALHAVQSRSHICQHVHLSISAVVSHL